MLNHSGWSLLHSLNPTAKQVPVAYGIKKLQISCVVEDDKIGTDFLEESITAFEDHVSWHDLYVCNSPVSLSSLI